MSETTSPAVDNGAGAPASPASLSDRVRSLRLNHRAEPPRRTAWLPWILCGIFFATTLLFGLEALAPVDEAAARKSADPSSELPRPLPGQAPGAALPKSASESANDILLEAKGNLLPVSTIQVSPLVGGRVVRLSFKEGDLVKKGDVLAQIERTEYDADVKHVSAQIRAARARWEELWKYRQQEIDQTKAELDDAKAQRDQLFSEFKRSFGLRESRSLSPREYEQAESAYKSMEFRVQRLQLAYDLLQKGPRDQRIEAAAAELAAYQAELIKAQWKLDNTTVTAPIDGTILTKKAEEGNFVTPSASANGLSASLCEMADLSVMEVDLYIAERDISKVFKHQACNVRAEAYLDRNYSGTVSRIMPQANQSKAAVPVRVAVAIPREEMGQYLRPEMGALVTFFNRKKEGEHGR